MSNFESTCLLCGCLESEHGGEGFDEEGNVIEVCTGCSAECSFEPEEELETCETCEADVPEGCCKSVTRSDGLEAQKTCHTCRGLTKKQCEVCS